MENGKGPYRWADIKLLAETWGADRSTIARLLGVFEKLGADSVYEDYSDVLPSWFALYYELEQNAKSICTFEGELMPGPLQTPDYARAVFEAGRLPLAPDVMERQVVARMERQEKMFRRDPAVRFEAVIGEGVLTRQVGGPEVMEGQRRHLRKLCDDYDVHVRVLTWEAGAHPAGEGAFVLLDFEGDQDPSVVYLESYAGARYLERPKQVGEYREIFQLVRQQSIPLEEYAA
jgi:hypothetical protein